MNKKDLSKILINIHRKLKGVSDGKVATYIPELSKADPKWFGIAVTDIKGNIAEIGDTNIKFSIQSISKVFTYALALEHIGRDNLRKKVGIEPTGEPFNAIIKLDAYNKPFNPMTNAGAIATSGLVKGNSISERLDHILNIYQSILASRPVVDIATYNSENRTGHRNRAIANLLTHFNVIKSSPEETLDLYFQQCSLMVTAKDLSILAATLANKGKSPITKQQSVSSEYIRDILSVMFSCGLYDGAGEWAFEVGLPAKSGVGGGIMAVVPGKCGIGIFSPPLDKRGNSVRGIMACKQLSKSLGWHVFDSTLYL